MYVINKIRCRLCFVLYYHSSCVSSGSRSRLKILMAWSTCTHQNAYLCSKFFFNFAKFQFSSLGHLLFFCYSSPPRAYLFHQTSKKKNSGKFVHAAYCIHSALALWLDTWPLLRSWYVTIVYATYVPRIQGNVHDSWSHDFKPIATCNGSTSYARLL